jgi:type II secretory pathway component GspD/PulD (secretin)
MMVESGETAVLGGLLTRTDVDVERGLPGLRKIPIVKWLFTVKEKQKSISNLVVFLTPRVILSSEDIDLAIKEAMRDVQTKLSSDWQEMFPAGVLPPEGSADESDN